MPPRLYLFNGGSAALKNRYGSSNLKFLLRTSPAQQRWITAKEKPLPTADQQQTGPNQDQLPHVSEEAAAVNQAMGKDGPDIDQGTPVQDVGEPPPFSPHDLEDSEANTDPDLLE